MMVLDTCALLWWTLEPERLSPNALKAIEQVEAQGGLISSITIWEIGIKLQKNQLAIGVSLEEYVQRVYEMNTIEIISVDEKMWMDNVALDWENKDPADRTIVALARTRSLPLITADKAMKRFYNHVIW